MCLCLPGKYIKLTQNELENEIFSVAQEENYQTKPLKKIVLANIMLSNNKDESQFKVLLNIFQEPWTEQSI